MKIILVYLMNIKGNYLEYQVDFIHNSFPNFARKNYYFLKGQ